MVLRDPKHLYINILNLSVGDRFRKGQVVKLPSEKAQKEFEKLIIEDEQASSLQTSASVQTLRDEVHTMSRKIDRLTDLYIAQDIEREDYLKRRRALVLEKKSVEERIALLERDAGYWLEPMRAWVKNASLLDEAAKSKDIPSKKSSLRKIFGSNLHLENRTLQKTALFPYAALRAARQKYSPKETSFIRATLYDQVRTFFQSQRD